ncbi:MAG: trigger factor [Arcanobacterium sp.]|nr:trigger factor [Arcanobacterium sp.]MDY5588400.1 trigger factor [Arcanobacterium sp.]
MKNSAQFTSETHAILSIAVSAEEFSPAYVKAAKKLAKQVNIPGFRPGKAPRRVLEAQIGKGYIIEQAINDSLDEYYQKAAEELGVSPMSRPEVEISQVPEMKGKDDTTELQFTIEADVRPEISLPDPATVTIEVASAEVTDDDVEAELTKLRERFATLTDVDRAAQEGDYVNIDLVATIGDENVDDLSGVSYKIGGGTMLEGQDEALTGAKAGAEVEFTTKLQGGEHEGEEAAVKVMVHSVKESTLPVADDEFAQLASEFDTIAELREDLKKNVEQRKQQEQLMGAEQKLIDALMEAANVPLPQAVIEEEMATHLSNEGLEPGDKHAEEIRPDVEKGLKMQLLLDEYALAYGVKTDQNELLQFLFQQAQMYGMDPSQFIQAASQAGQIGAFTAELARNKGVIAAMRVANVVDPDGNKVDVAAVLGAAPEDELTPEYGKAPTRVIEPKADSAHAAEKPAAQKADKAEKPATAQKETAKQKAHNAEETSASEAPSAPAKSAKKAEWVAYRVATGELDEAAAKALTKDELINFAS